MWAAGIRHPVGQNPAGCTLVSRSGWTWQDRDVDIIEADELYGVLHGRGEHHQPGPTRFHESNDGRTLVPEFSRVLRPRNTKQPLPREILAQLFRVLRSRPMKTAVNPPVSGAYRRNAEHSPFQNFRISVFSISALPKHPFPPATLFCPPPGSATGSFNGLPPKGNSQQPSWQQLLAEPMNQ